MKSTIAKKTTTPDCLNDSIHPLLAQTFSEGSEQLPTIAQIKKHIYTDRQWMEAGEFDPHKHLLTMQLRESYVGQSFILLSEEFIISLQQLCTGFNTIVELGGGIGWLSHWLDKYGVSMLACIDNKTWSEFPKNRFLDTVQHGDSLEYVKHHPEVELFLLAWPQEDDTATQIWHTLLPGQYLLYIGESRGGCTANNHFFDSTEGYEVANQGTKEMKRSFLSFEDFHDQPHLYRKS